MVTHTGEVPNSSAPYKNNAVLLKVVSDSGNVRRDLGAVCETNSCDLSHGRVRLLGSSGLNRGAYASLLRAGLVYYQLLL